MDGIYEWVGFIVYWCLIILMMGIVIQSFVQTSSFVFVLILASFKHGRASHVRWRYVPREFFKYWREFANEGPSDFSNKYLRWQGTFNWTIHPKAKP